jgi:hypothetical protein
VAHLHGEIRQQDGGKQRLIKDEEKIFVTGGFLDLAEAEAENREAFDEQQGDYDRAGDGDGDQKE